MDERQQQIKVGAGQEDSNLNQDLIDFLQRWGSWILFGLAAVMAGYVGLDWLDRLEVQEVNSAFTAYEEAASGATPSPDALGRIAEEFEGVRAVPEMARLKSADVLLGSVISGLRAGAVTNEEGGYDDSELLSAEERTRYLDQADGLYATVLDATRDDPGRRLIAINAVFGRVAVAESRGDVEAARSALEQAQGLCDAAGFEAHKDYATDRLDELADGIPVAVALPSRDSMPELPAPPPPPEPITEEVTLPETMIEIEGDDSSETDPGDAEPAADDAEGSTEGEPGSP